MPERDREPALKRWGPDDDRLVRLDQLDPVTLGIILSILTARKNAEAARSGDAQPGETMPSDTRTPVRKALLYPRD